ncbi:type II and III secretion system protein family protein [Pseudogemmobacter hezensis]|uniref:type II and III secretion system protein family protein n=1 Tax=Pseudogemmobacter hezensis TaxID=2737662 RepID=UPI0026575083|nr:type II and III secretion system protein family protein [Pseudogemmobacter hezensis]
MPAILQAQDVWSVGSGVLKLNVSEAKFIKLEKPATAVFLSDPSIAEIDLQSARYLYIVGRGVGTTNLFVLGENDEEIISATISVNIDAKKLSSAAQHSVTGGSVKVSTHDGAVFINGRVKSEADSATAGDVVAALLGEGAIIVNLLQIETSAQVNLQVRIAEVSKSISEDLGISLSGSSSNGKRSFTSPAGDGSGYSLSIGSGSRNLNLVLDALSQRGLVTILSEPNLTTRSGEEASFLAGGRVPYPVRGEGNEITYQLEPVGVELKFTPTVYGTNQIRLDIGTSIRNIDPASSGREEAPALTERSATTTVELGSGQSFAIAGMFHSDSSQSIRGIPGIGSVPIIGALFRSSRFARGESELIIIVTPWLVAPDSSARPSVPQDGVNIADSVIPQALTGKMIKPSQVGNSGVGRARRGGFMLQ